MAERELDPEGTETETKNAPPAPPAVRYLSGVLANLIVLSAIAWIFDLPRAVGLLPFPQQFLAVILGLVLTLIFLTLRADRKNGGAPPWYDQIAAFVAFVVSGWLTVRFPVLSEEIFYRPVESLMVAAPLLLLVMEALRRVVGWPLVIVVGVFLAYGFLGHLVPGQLIGRYNPPGDIVPYLALDPNALVGVPLRIGATVVIAFVLFGQLLARTGGSQFFSDMSVALMGRFRGGSAKIAVVASSLFGTVSGSAVSNVASTGVVTIPLMRRGGYSASAAGGIEAVASTGGQLMPPIMGAAAFLMAEFLAVPYREVILAALVPAIFYYVAVFIVADLDAARNGIAPVPREEIPPAGRTLRGGLHFLIPFGVLILALFSFNFSPQLSALYAALALAAGGLVIGYRGQRPTWRDALGAIGATGYAVRDIVMIVAAAGLVIGILNVTGLGFALTIALVNIGGGDVVVLLLLSALISIVLGMGMPTVGVYVLLATLVAPALIEVGVPKIAAHLFVLYFGMMSMITPPIALAAFTAASLAGAPPMRTGLMAVRYGWSAYIVPFLFVAAPGLLFIGSAQDVAIAISSIGAGIWLISVAIAGHLGTRLSPLARGGFVAAGLLLFWPDGYLSYALSAKGLGVALGALLVILALGRRRCRSL